MKTTREELRHTADTLKEVTHKLEEALRLAQEIERKHPVRSSVGDCERKDDLVRG